MDIILQKIIETDRDAREKVDVQKERLAMIEEEIASEKIGIDRQLDTIAQEEIAKAKNAMELKKQMEFQRIDESFNITESQLKAAFNENRDKWVNDIFENVTK